MERKNVLLVMVIILVPIVLMGSLAVLGADNIPPEEEQGGEATNGGEDITDLEGSILSGLTIPGPNCISPVIG